ncbi:MAG: pyridoxal phosphate-dependent aminotransferase, partial [Candidatus Omnitrophica bacterium]|nr:pyridoxal phosphate-dependent aminotransferase [Candidatus Omnitrophota bacterium]MBU1933500.1 pyridoxal phosphate-dependent aminotransferase [Candidatus Omnitrophota bacterium]
MNLSSRVKNVSASLTLAITAKAKKMKQEGIDVIGFGSGEPDFDTPDNIKDAAIKAIQNGLTKYTPASGTDALKKAVCDKFRRDSHLTYKPSQIVISCGAKHSIYNIIQTICDKGDEVIIPVPYWLSYPEMVKLAQGIPVFIDTDEKSGFKISADQLKKAVTKKTKALILNSPSNPTGSTYDEAELKDIAEVAVKNDILIISDEIYEKILFDGRRYVSIASINKDIFRNTIVVNGVSKSFAMTGWRIGYIASPLDDITSAIKNLQSHSTSNPSSISQAAALEAVNGGDSIVRDMVKEFEKRRDYIVQRINSVKGLSCFKPGGAFYVFCKIEKRDLSGISLSERLLEEARVAVIPGEPFGSDRHIRLSFATSMDNIKKGMDRI